MFNSNLGQWLSGSRKGREIREMHDAWDRTQAAWHASPISQSPSRDPVEDLALVTSLESWRRAKPWPPSAVAVEVAKVTSDLVEAENIGDIDPVWDAIEGDVATAVEFRRLVAKRFRFITDFNRVYDVFKRCLLDVYDAFYAAIPDGCWGQGSEEEGFFEVPLVELLEEPARLIREIMGFPYDPDAERLDLFCDLRLQLERNLVEASGFRPNDDRPEILSRLVYPQNQARKTPGELADLYLKGTPFRTLLDVPVPFHIGEQARFEHCHIIGGTGHGKTQLMQRLIHADLVAAQTERRSVVVIDSQGDLINRLSRLALFSPDAENSLADRLVIIDPADVEFPPALNLFDAHLERLEHYRPVDRERVLNGVVEVYENFFGDLLGAELTQKQGVVFKYLARLMLVVPGATIHTLIQLMENPKPYLEYMAKLEGSARYFFETEFFDPAFSQTKRQIQRRLWGVLSTPAFERMFAQSRNKLDLFQALQDGKIILINTAKDLLKQEGSQLFGRFFLGLLTQATLERATLDPEDRTPTFVFVDEAQEYFDDTIETILNQARKYKTSITLAHQALDQLSPRLRAVLHSNTSMKCAGGVSARDARALAEELHTQSDFIESMRRRQARTEFAVWIRNRTPQAIRMAVPLGFLERQPIATEEAFAAVLDANRSRYCGTVEEVETALRSLRRERPFEPRAERARARDTTEASTVTAAVRVEQPTPAETYPSPYQPTKNSNPPDPPPAQTQSGKGGPQHKYLQHLLKSLAEERGFRAVIEEAVQGGQVDVGLHRADVTIACEISVTSTPEYEAQNLAKCLRAGFARIWAIAPDPKRRRAIEQAAKRRLAAEDISKVEFLTPEDAVLLLDDLVAQPTESTKVRGYTVTVKKKTVSGSEAKDRRDRIARVLSNSTRGLKSEP